MDKLPVQPGTYTLILELTVKHIVDVGKLGRFEFHPGIYIYLGSAYGPGGLRARLRRHLRGGCRPHWHIDYLRMVGEVLGYGYLIATEDNSSVTPTECQWSQVLTALPGVSIPSAKFGASDCKSGCRAHLIRVPALDFLDEIPPLLAQPGEKLNFALRLFNQ
jgi:Uri superfamily endonuclease